MRKYCDECVHWRRCGNSSGWGTCDMANGQDVVNAGPGFATLTTHNGEPMALTLYRWACRRHETAEAA